MAHPQMYRDDDPSLARVREIALAFPGALEKVSHGRPNFYTTKIFTYYGGSVKVAGEWVQHERSILVLPDESEREALLARQGIFVPGYLGPYGWLGLDLPSRRSSWDEVTELIDASYRNTAGQRLIAALDAAGRGTPELGGPGGSH